MKCENCFCVYQKEGKCCLDEIVIDVTGQCESCIYIDISNDELKKYKQELSKKRRL